MLASDCVCCLCHITVSHIQVFKHCLVSSNIVHFASWAHQAAASTSAPSLCCFDFRGFCGDVFLDARWQCLQTARYLWLSVLATVDGQTGSLQCCQRSPFRVRGTSCSWASTPAVWCHSLQHRAHVERLAPGLGCFTALLTCAAFPLWMCTARVILSKGAEYS